ncbi:hypothetical protein [Cecembia calidifontis]|jgi:hypothetical protein|uniref:Uncharacterized protein n=1 Tax=Cecembia calidifontis TaxID=1187080 RepID=A0A4Q7P6K9_9BACT|nr:hypothetical protein [Cecembia calidifontis]RZS95726.1 hypothetical protein BC751_1266 [Cecembia calidifontis]
MSPSKDSLSPEMIKILKIFGIGSLLFVFLLSFFNEKRADNSGDANSLFRITDADRIFFKNVRAAYYELEERNDAKINIYRYGKRIKDEEMPNLNLSILINRIKDEAYIFVEPIPQNLPFKLIWKNISNTETGEFIFYGGGTLEHYDFVSKLSPLLEESFQLEMEPENGKRHEILTDPKQREALKTTIKDYYRLTNKPK